MPELLENKVCLVSGAPRGIGRGIVKVFAEQGATVYANARTPGSLDEIVEETRSCCGAQVNPLYFDVTDSKEAKEAIFKIKKERGMLDVLVNNAGIMKEALLGMVTKQSLREIYETNVFAVVDLLQLASKLMVRQKSGSIVNIASIVGELGNSGQTAYSSSKGAVIALTKTASKELAEHNIRVNAVAPGVIDTDLLRSSPDAKARFAIGMGRLGTPEDVANACLFFASDLSTYVTGQTLIVSGGAII